MNFPFFFFFFVDSSIYNQLCQDTLYYRSYWAPSLSVSLQSPSLYIGEYKIEFLTTILRYICTSRAPTCGFFKALPRVGGGWVEAAWEREDRVVSFASARKEATLYWWNGAYNSSHESNQRCLHLYVKEYEYSHGTEIYRWETIGRGKPRVKPTCPLVSQQSIILVG